MAVKAAQRAFYEGAWARMSPMERQELMMTFGNEIMAHAEELAVIESTDNGKKLSDAFGDIGFSSMIIKYFASQCFTPN